MGKTFSLITHRKLFVVIIVFASILRLWKISEVPVSLFSDELDVGYQAYSVIKTGRDYSGNMWPLNFQSYADMRTPLYIYSSVPTVYLFGITPLGVRLPAAIFGVLGVWGMYLLANEIFDQKKYSFFKFQFSISEISAFFLAISPWHIQYSRAAFEVTMLLMFFLFGIFFFLKSFKQSKYLWLSTAFLITTAWIYSTAKLFTPALLIFLFLVWRKEILKFKKSELARTAAFGLLIGLPLVYSILFGGGAQRAGYISVFTDPTSSGAVDYSRLVDAQVQGTKRSIISKIGSRVIHNKFALWSSKVADNYFQTFSTEFLFMRGDPNLRHSIEGVGQLYKVEIISLVLGTVLFYVYSKNSRMKLLIAFWILFGVFPSAITRDGGTHATRLILLLPPLIFLISYGIVETTRRLNDKYKFLFLASYFLLLTSGVISYQHNYWIHNPWYSERSWQAGYKELIQSIKEVDSDFDKIIISNANDDPRIIFASYYPVSPKEWQKGLEKINLAGFGDLQHFGKYYFGQLDGSIGIYKIDDYMDERTLYVATAREVKGNLVMEPDKAPEGLKLIQTVTYPSSEPAFYFFKRSEDKIASN